MRAGERAERRGGRHRPSAFSQPRKRLLTEAAVILGAIPLAGFLVYHFAVRVIRNPRPLGGRNVAVSRLTGAQTQVALAIDPHHPRLLLAASNDSDFEEVRIYTSTNGGATWRRGAGPPAPGGSCAHGEPRVAIDRAGREYLAFLAGTFCGDNLTPYLAVGERDGDTGRWHLVRVTPPAWKYGFDDGPALAVDERSGAVYAAFTRSYSAARATTVVSVSRDHGRHWTVPVAVSETLRRPHLASIAVAPDGDVYVAGIDAILGVWVARSTDGGRSFGRPRQAAALAPDPAVGCALSAESPVPTEERTCIGPDPTVVIRGSQVDVVYGDGGSNGAGDVFLRAFDRTLRPLFRAEVNPPDGGSPSRQFLPVAAADPATRDLWACWYDTTFDPNAHRAWFTCSASRDGRSWTKPERAASVPTSPSALLADSVHFGLYPALAAAAGTAHPMWIDGRSSALQEEVYTAALPESAAFAR